MTSQNDFLNITGVILAGGRGRRVDGKDKGLVEFRGRPLIEHVIDAIQPQVNGLIINANRNLKDYGLYGYPLVSDVLPDFQGPLAGMLTGLQNTSTDSVLFVPCDTPELPANLVQRMADTMASLNVDVCFPNDGERNHAAIVLMKRSLQGSLQGYLESGARKAQDWVLAQQYTAVDFSDCPGSFRNLNRPGDFEV
jgi:molybdopterin-guanine dinucleotide biosynthesis protein A